MGLDEFLESISAIQLKIRDYLHNESELLEIDSAKRRFIKRKTCEYLGIKIPRDRLCLNSKGRVCMAKPECVKCGSPYVSNNGGKTRYPKTIIGTTISVRIQKYICNDCGHAFDTPIEHLIQRYAKVTNEIQALGVKLYVDCQLSGREIGDIIEQLFGVRVSGDSIRRWSEKYGKIAGEYKFEGKYSGIYHYDEQRVMINGEEKWRYVILDTNGIIIKDEVKDDRKQETICNFVVENLKDKKVDVIITDLDNKYPEVIRKLRTAISTTQKIPLSDIKIKHQLCIFHLFRDIIMTLKKSAGFSPFARKKLPYELDNLRIALFKCFYYPIKGDARKAFDKIFENRWKYKKKIRNLIENINKNFDNLTCFMRDDITSVEPGIPKTNNKLEQYFRCTHPDTIKKKYRSTQKINAYIKGIALDQSLPKNKHWLQVIGLCFSIFSALGKIAQLI